MRRKDINEELQASMRWMPTLPVNYPIVRNLVRFLGRLGLSKTPVDPSVTFEDVALRNASVRVYKPSGKPSGVGVLWIHGGGLIMGDVSQDNRICSLYSKELDAVVVSVEYRLAPESSFPAGLNDCMDAWTWFLENAEKLGVNPDCIAIAGQSGGGCLAASLCQKISSSVDVAQPAVQLLWCPMLDDRTGDDRSLDDINHLVWPNKSNRAAWNWYLEGAAGAQDVPRYAVPARSDSVKNLPPTWIGIGDIDLFYEESCAYADKLRTAGVLCEMDVTPDAHHGFEIFACDTDLVKNYFARHFDWIRSKIN